MTRGSGLVEVARSVDWGGDHAAAERALSNAADERTRALIDGFVHQAGPPPGRFQWVALGSHARGELHCASDQDHALVWDSARAARSSYAADLAAEVITGLEDFGMRRCDGGYMADSWSQSREEWEATLRDRIAAPTPEAIVDADVFLDLRPLRGDLDASMLRVLLATGGDSPLLLHGLARAAIGFGVPLHAFGRMPRGEVDLKKSGLAPIVLLARLYGLRCGSVALSTTERLHDSGRAGLVSAELADRLVGAFEFLSALRITRQLEQVGRGGVTLSDRVVVGELPATDQEKLRDAFRAVKGAQSVTSLIFRTDL